MQLCLSVPTPQSIEGTPGCPSVSNPCTPSRTPGLLGEVFNRRRSTPISHGRNLSQSASSTTNNSPSTPTIDLLNNINTQTLNNLLEIPLTMTSQDTQPVESSMPTTPVGISLTDTFTTPLQTIAEKETYVHCNTNLNKSWCCACCISCTCHRDEHYQNTCRSGCPRS